MSRTQPLATALRRVTVSSRPSTTARLTPKRFASTVPADKPRSWRSGLLRWGVAGAIVYYYNTTNIFAEAPAYNTQNSSLVDSSLPTLDSVTAERRQRAVAAAPRAAALADSPATASSSATASVVAADNSQPSSSGPDGAVSPGELEEEADQQGAFNPETGEINWDCPCLGGMAHGPCGENFKAAFSCFVFSKEEPKGVDCIDKFKAMQDCFREHPDIYGSELDDDEDEEGDDAPVAAETAAAAGIAPSSSESVATPSPVKTNTANTPSQDNQAPRSDTPSNPDAVKVGGKGLPTKVAAKASTERAKSAGKQVASEFGAKEGQSESEDAVPKAWHDAADSQPRMEK